MDKKARRTQPRGDVGEEDGALGSVSRRGWFVAAAANAYRNLTTRPASEKSCASSSSDESYGMFPTAQREHASVSARSACAPRRAPLALAQGRRVRRSKARGGKHARRMDVPKMLLRLSVRLMSQTKWALCVRARKGTRRFRPCPTARPPRPPRRRRPPLAATATGGGTGGRTAIASTRERRRGSTARSTDHTAATTRRTASGASGAGGTTRGRQSRPQIPPLCRQHRPPRRQAATGTRCLAA